VKQCPRRIMRMTSKPLSVAAAVFHRLKTSGGVNDSLESAVVRFDAPPYRLLPDHTLRGSRQRLGAG